MSHCVSLWNGRMDSQAAADPERLEVLGNGLKLGPPLDGDVAGAGCGMEEQGQASPSEIPLMAVRDWGQMGANPDMRTFQSVGSGTIGIDEACVDGWARR